MTDKNKHSIQKPILSFIIYFIVVVICIPLLLIKKGQYEILSMYLPNVDLIANLITYTGKSFKLDYFNELYLNSPNTTASKITTTWINYMALLGLTFLVASHTKLTNSISIGWSIAFIMALVTYLLPTGIINSLMDKMVQYTDDILNKYNVKYNRDIIRYIPSIISGIILTIGFILLEKNIIQTFPNTLENIANSFISLGGEFSKHITKHLHTGRS